MRDAHQVVVDYWDAAANRDWATFADLPSDQVVHQAPQTRERVCGRMDYVRFNAEGFPGDWHLKVERVVAETRRAASWVEISDGSTHYVGLCFFDFDEDGLIELITDFWPPSSELPSARIHLVERY